MITVNAKLFRALIAFNFIFILAIGALVSVGFNRTPDAIETKAIHLIDDNVKQVISISYKGIISFYDKPPKYPFMIKNDTYVQSIDRKCFVYYGEVHDYGN